MQPATPVTPPTDSGSARFKRGMRHLSVGVTVIGAYAPDGSPAAMTATAVSSLSAEPPSLLVCVNRTASMAQVLVRGVRFSVNVLAANQIEVAQAFGNQLDVRGAGRFVHGTWRRVDGTGVPLLAGSRVSFECEVSHVHEWATHHIVIGSVLDVHFSRTASQSLVYGDGAYHAVG